MRYLISIVLILLFSCGEAEPEPVLSRTLSCEVEFAQIYPIGVSLGTDITEEDVVAIRSALARIEEEVGEEVFVLARADKWEHDRCGMVFLSRGDVPPSEIEGAETLAFTWNRYALTEPYGDKFICTSVVHLSRSLVIGRVALAVRHELMHAIGLKHDKVENSVMNEMPYDDSILIDADREAVRNSINGGNTTTCNL